MLENRQGENVLLLPGKLLRSGGKVRQYWKKSAIDRFVEKVSISNDCWEWLAGKRNGYGSFYVGGCNSNIIQVPAHRFSYEQFVGPIPVNYFVCHRCDNPGCVRPAHLFLGTVLDNNQDMMKKGRFKPHYLYGETNAASKLTDKEVVTIWQLYATGQWSHRRLAYKYRVSHPIIRQVVNGILRPHLHLGRVKRVFIMGRKISSTDAASIRKRYAEGGISQREIAASYSVQQTVVSRIIRGVAWRELSK